ncbi:MAG: glycosyltransferase family 9 protein [Candidatus Marinimicrobia bacterium]|nr:glycosyltransferase family 9 protein [Candidatus Neomarinimicrobiota bacterium]MDD5582148.1 glycosyltransferase family 9 protein [Candidatus Neomarinimicrobiota bacterium]
MKQSLNNFNPSHILIIQTAFIGDVVMSTPTIQAICDQWPDADIDLLTRPESAILFSRHPRIRRVYTLDKSNNRKKYTSLKEKVRELRPNSYDLAFSIQGSLTSSLLMILCGIKRRVGFYDQKFLTRKVKPPKGLHVRKRYLTLLEPFTDRKFSDETFLYLRQEDFEKAEKIIQSLHAPAKKILSFAPGSIRETKKWPASYWTELLLLVKDKNFDVVFIGSAAERDLCSSIIQHANVEAYNAAGELNVLESAALIQKVALLVCNDSAPLHLGNAVNTPVYAFFGPTVKAFGCYPYRDHDKVFEINLDCRPCGKHGHNRCPKKHFKCMIEQYPETIAKDIIERF